MSLLNQFILSFKPQILKKFIAETTTAQSE